MRQKGLIIILSAPSGAGKSTLCGMLVNRLPNLEYSISYTTRAPRPGEKDKVDYFFVSEKKIKQMAREGKFAEWACVHDHLYGTPRHFLAQEVRSGKDIILDIDVQGGEKIRKAFPDAVSIFVMTPSIKELEKRLRQRKKDDEAVIRKRLINARKELRHLPHYQYLVINDTLSKAADEIQSIITAEHLKIEHMPAPRF
jgi:guanylate kinase